MLTLVIKKILIIFLILQLNACSTYGIFYNNLPFLTALRLNEMFGLSDAQELIVKQRTEELQAWLKTDAIHVIIERLSQTKKLWQDGYFHEASKYFEEGIELSIKEVLAAASPKIISFLLTLDEANASQYLAYNREKSEDWFDYAESQESKIESRIKQLEKWFGRLSKEQSSRVADIVFLVPSEQKIRIDNNKNWVDNALKASLQRDETILKSWLMNPSIWWQEDYKRLKKINRNQNYELVTMMIETMSEEQQKAVPELLDDWIKKLQSII